MPNNGVITNFKRLQATIGSNQAPKYVWGSQTALSCLNLLLPSLALLSFGFDPFFFLKVISIPKRITLACPGFFPHKCFYSVLLQEKPARGWRGPPTTCTALFIYSTKTSSCSTKSVKTQK
jgi:hypothetical protein